MNDSRVSVIIPCYNLGCYLQETIDSVLDQSFQSFEILVVDDGSTDEETRRLLADLDKPSTRVVRSENRGLPAAKNLGLSLTTGQYVCMLDADDRLAPAFLEKSVAALDEDASLAFVSHWLRTFGDEIWEWTPTSCDLPALLDTNTVNGAALVRREALQAVGGFDETMRDGCEDWDLWITLVERGFRGRILPEVLFQYRRRADSMSRLMMQGDGHARLYRRLARKHAETYTRHLGGLLLRREADISNLRRHTHDLALEYFQWLGPELEKWRDDVAVLERKVARIEREQARENQRARLQAALDESEEMRRLSEQRFEEEHARLVEADRSKREALDAQHLAELEAARLRSERDHHARVNDVVREQALELDKAANQARSEIARLHASLSWRITKPLRALYRALGLAGRDSL